MIDRLLHISVLVTDLQRALPFYCEVLGLEQDPNRPDLGYPGAWLIINAEQQIHLLQIPEHSPPASLPAHGGRDRHGALAVDDLSVIEQRLTEHDIAFTRSRSGRAALFCRDPDGNTWELIQATA